MSPLKIIPSLALVLAGACLCAGRIPAQPPDTNSIPAVSLVVTDIQEESIPGLPPIKRAYASAGTNQCAFFIPRGFRLETVAGGSLSVVALDDSCFITLRVVEPMPPGKKILPVKTCRAWLLAQYPDAKILSEFSRALGAYSGPAFDLQISVPGVGLKTLRVLFVPSDAGVLEFKLVASPDKFHKATYRFNNLLLSFRAARNGKLENVPLSGKF